MILHPHLARSTDPLGMTLYTQTGSGTVGRSAEHAEMQAANKQPM